MVEHILKVDRFLSTQILSEGYQGEPIEADRLRKLFSASDAIADINMDQDATEGHQPSVPTEESVDDDINEVSNSYEKMQGLSGARISTPRNVQLSLQKHTWR